MSHDPPKVLMCGNFIERAPASLLVAPAPAHTVTKAEASRLITTVRSLILTFGGVAIAETVASHTTEASAMAIEIAFSQAGQQAFGFNIRNDTFVKQFLDTVFAKQ